MGVFSSSIKSLSKQNLMGKSTNRRMAIGLWLDGGNRESNLWETYTFFGKCVFGNSLESITRLENLQLSASNAIDYYLASFNVCFNIE